MPIAKWICRGCANREVELSHFATTRCGETVCHPDYAAAVLGDRVDQPIGTVRVTNGLSCPRRAAIEASEEYALDPTEALPPISGTAWHYWIETFGGAGCKAEVEVAGFVAGIPVVGHVDRVRDGVVEDWKTVQFLPKESVKPEHVVQTSVYGYLLGPDYTRGRIWYKTHFELKPVEFDLLPIDEALEHKPYGGEFTVAELYGQMSGFVSGADWRAMPLAGKSMMFGDKSMCHYCSVREECTVAAMGEPF